MPTDDEQPERPRHRLPNEDGLAALGEAIERRTSRHPVSATSRSRRRRRRIWVRRGIVGVALLVVLALLAGIADYIYLGTLAHKTHNEHEQTGGKGLNILLVGSTTRCGLKHQNQQYGTCAQGVTGVNSDIVMIAHLENGTVSLLSVPRDLFEPNARFGSDPANKIDAALYQGPSQLTQAVEEDFGIPINHLVELNFDTFSNVVNAIDGVDMYFPMRVYDAESSLNIEHPGCYHLDGIHSLEVVRARHLQIGFPADGRDPHNWPQEPQSDIARIRRTHEFLRVVAAKLASQNLADVPHDQGIATAILPDLTVDDQFSWQSMVALAVSYAHTNIASVPQYTYPVVLYFGDAQNFYDYIYKGGNYGEVEFPVQPGGWLSVDKIFGIKPGFSPWNGKALPLPSKFPISIMNGTGVANQAVTVAHQLQGKGFRVVKTGDVAPVGSQSETVVWYGGAPPPKSGNWDDPAQAAALRVMTDLTGPVTLGYDPHMVSAGAMVTIQTGTDLLVARKDFTRVPVVKKPKHHTGGPTGATGANHTTTTRVTATTVYDPGLLNRDGNFSSPTALAEPLKPWDPRACRANQRVFQDRSGDG